MSATGTLGVTPEELEIVGNKMKEISQDVDTIFNDVKGIVNQVTSNDSWKSEASTQFEDTFKVHEKAIDEDLANLSELGPTLVTASNEYSTAEETNVSQISELQNL